MMIEIVKTKLSILLCCCMYSVESAICLPRALPYCNKKGSQACRQNSSLSRPFADRQGRRKCRFCRSKNLSASSAMSSSVFRNLIVMLFACFLTTRQLLHASPKSAYFWCPISCIHAVVWPCPTSCARRY